MTWARLSSRSEGLVVHKREPPSESRKGEKKWRIKGERMETNSNSICSSHKDDDDDKKRKREWAMHSHAWFCCKAPCRVGKGSKIHTESAGMWMRNPNSSAIGIPLSFCTGTEEIAGWEKVRGPTNLPQSYFQMLEVSQSSDVSIQAAAIKGSYGAWNLLRKAEFKELNILSLEKLQRCHTMAVFQLFKGLVSVTVEAEETEC